MSGHSKWSTIKHQKAVADNRRGQLFSKLVKAVALAARDGTDPDKNFKLRLAIEKAKTANVPKANIDRALRTAEGKLEGSGLDEIVYEGYGPGKIAVMAEAVTDNRNRTTAELKKLFEINGGSLAGPGSVKYLFSRLGLLVVKKPQNPEAAILKIIDWGVENVEESEATIEVYTPPEQLETVAKKIEQSGFTVQSKDLVMEPKSAVAITDPVLKKKILKFMEALEGHDDVQKAFANFDFPA